MYYENEDYRISDDREEIQLDIVESLLRSSYWASERSLVFASHFFSMVVKLVLHG